MNNEHISEEARKLMALAGIQESDKKFLNNEAFSEEQNQVEKDNPNLYPKGWKNMDGTFMGPNAFSQEKLDAITKMLKESESNLDSNFIEIVFDQEEVEPGPDDEKLYKIG